MNTSIRLVRCPKCLKILPELPNIPVYKCGGCGAVLQAKRPKNGVERNGSRARETGPLQKYEPTVLSSSGPDPEGDHPPMESSPETPINTKFSDEHACSTEPNSLQEDKLSRETNESEVQGEHEHLLEKDAGPRKIESLDHSSEKSHDQTSDEIFDSCDSFQGNEDSSAETSISRKKYEEGYSPKSNVVTSGYEIEDFHGVLAEEEKSSSEPQKLHDPETTRSSESEPKFVVEKELQNTGNENGKFTNGSEDSQGEFSREGKHSKEPRTIDEDGTHSSVKEPLKLDDENEPSSGDDEHRNADDIYLKESSEVGQSVLIRPEDILAPLSPDDIYLEESPEVGPSFHRISSEETLDTTPINPRDPITPFSPDDTYLEESPEVGPNVHRIISEEKLDSLPISSRVPFAPLSPDDTYTEGSPEVGPNFHRLSSEEMLDTVPLNPRVSIAPLSPDVYQEGSPEVGPNFHRVSSEEMLDTLPHNPRVSIAPFSPDMYLEGSPEVGPNFHRISSEEMLDTLPINPRVSVGSMSKSPTRTYYAGVESEYSYGEAEELAAHVSHPYSRKVKGTGTTSTNRSRQKIGFKVKNKQSEQDWRRHELPEPSKHSRPIRTSMTAANNDPRGSYVSRNSLLHQGKGSPVSSTQNAFMHNGQFRQQDAVIGFDPEKVELLRMVHELEDKINRTQMSKPISGERLPTRDVQEEIHTGRYYDNQSTGSYPYAGSKYSGHHISHPQGVGWANTQPRSSRLAFSGEASECRNHIDCRCSHCYHQDMRFSPKLSSHCIHCQHAAHPRHDYVNMYSSYSPSPQQYTSSEFSHEIHADNQKHDHEMKMLYLREKHQGMKRHLRPVSGGVPIINCYHCSELLQLPADFLLFRRRCHQLRCGSCNTILKYSIVEKSHLVPYVIKIQAPLPSEMDEYNNIVGRRTLASTSHANNPQDGGPVSFSDDLEPSFSINGSSESLPSAPSSSHALNDRKMKTVMEIYNMNNNPRDNIEAAGPSSSKVTRVKPSSEIEELPAASGSPLHRLMGYESARQVLFAKSEDESDYGMGYYMNRQIR